MLRKSLTSVLFIILFGLIGHGQDNPTNLSMLGTNEDSVRAVVYLQKANLAVQSNKEDSIEIYANQAIKYSRSSGFSRGKADAFLILANLRDKQDRLPRALRYYFGSAREYDMISDSISSSKVKIKIAKIYKENGLFQKSLEYYLIAEKSLLKNGWNESELKLLENIGDIYFELKQYNKALFYFLRLEKSIVSENEKSRLTEVYHYIVKCYNALGQYENALGYNQKILEYHRKNGNHAEELVALNNIGFICNKLGNYEEALAYFEQSQQLEETMSDTINPATWVNIAIVYQNLGDEKNALFYMLKAEGIAEASGDIARAAEMDHLTSVIYFNNEDFYNALRFNKEARRLAAESGDMELVAATLLTSSKIHEALYDFENAMDTYRQYLTLNDSLLMDKAYKENELLEQQFIIERSEREIENLLANEDLQDLEYQRLKLENATKEQQIDIFRKNDSIQKITIENQDLEKRRALQEKLLTEEKLAAEIKDREIKDLKQKEKIQQLNIEKQELVQKEQESKIEILNKEKEISDLNLRKIQARNKFLGGIILLALIVIYLVFRGMRFAKRTNKILIKQNNEIERQRDEIDYERRRSDKLLLNILPEEIAEELKEKGSATPKQYQTVSVLFTDFKGFTMIAEKLTPEELVKELDICFLAFDRIIDKHGLEKIKTIGDAYMCAGGIPVENTTNPIDIVKAGLEIKEYMDNLKAEREAKGEAFWELRIGIHTGSVVAGVVGKNKFAYDIWGDAVNTASRMESSGIPGKVNISGTTYSLVKDKFKCTYRGKVKAKNKGEIDMYIVEGET
jgi:class 3 adenylate cyclase/tetratricopeptide (TPR) repeat protein